MRGRCRASSSCYEHYDWNACTTDCKFLNRTALYDTLTYAALKYGEADTCSICTGVCSRR